MLSIGRSGRVAVSLEIEEAKSGSKSLTFRHVDRCQTKAFFVNLVRPLVTHHSKAQIISYRTSHILSRALTLVSKRRLCRVVPGASSCTKPGLCRDSDTARHGTGKIVSGQRCWMQATGAQGHALSKSNLVVIVAGISRQPAKFKFNMLMKAL